MIKTLSLAIALCAATAAQAQTPSGLLTGPVTYTSNLTSGNIYGDTHVFTVQNADGSTSTCAANVPGQPSCYIVKYVLGTPYENLQASDGTSNGILDCYTWEAGNVSQFILNDQGYCQSSFYGGAPGEQRVGLYCGNLTYSDVNGNSNLTCTASWDGNTPYQTLYTIHAAITHHPVKVWIPAHYHTQAHWETWQQIDSAVVTVTPQQ